MTNPIIITKTISVDGFLDERNREIFDENDFNGMKSLNHYCFFYGHLKI